MATNDPGDDTDVPLPAPPADETDVKPPAPPAAGSSAERPRTLIEFDAATLRRTLFVIFVAVIAYQIVIWSWSLLAGFAFNLLLAWLVAISFDPVVSWLSHKGIRRGAATAIVATSVLLLLAAFITAFGGVLATQITGLVEALPQLVLDIVDWINRTFNANIDPVQITNNLNLTPEQITNIASNLAGGVFGVLVGIVGALFDFVTVVVFSFYFSADSPRIKRFIASWLKPARQVTFIKIWDISVQKAGGFVISKLALATLSAVFHCGFFYLIDIPYWLPMGIFAGVVSQFIPTIGTYIGVALPALFAVFEQPIDVLWIVIFATVYQQIENYVFTPRISNKTMDINSGVALAAVFIGAALFGPIGAIIGIPLVAIIIAIVEAYGQRYDIHPFVERSAD
ncbi:MAG: AI-2E family transporter [Actinobacteria bacterium]|nr:AI-2E family transporter [Actinomycetota bacterium]